MKHQKTIAELLETIENDVRFVVRDKYKELDTILNSEPSLFHSEIKNNINKEIISIVLLKLAVLSNEHTAEDYLVFLEDIEWSSFL